MRQEKIILLLVVIVVILSMLLVTRVGYAVETGEPIKINEKKLLGTEISDFKVEFTGQPTYTGNGNAVLQITDLTSATINITGLKSVGDYVTARFNISNKSDNIYADINVQVTNTNNEYFKVTSKLSKSTIEPKNGNTTLEITVELIKLPIYKTEVTSINASILANPKY